MYALYISRQQNKVSQVADWSTLVEDVDPNTWPTYLRIIDSNLPPNEQIKELKKWMDKVLAQFIKKHKL